MAEPKDKNLTRRTFLKGSIGIVAGLASATTKVPYVFAKKPTTLRVLGTHVTLQEDIRKRAMADLGINLVFEPKGSAAVLQKGSTKPESFDIYEQWSDSIKILLNAGAIQPIDKQRIKDGPKLTIWQKREESFLGLKWVLVIILTSCCMCKKDDTLNTHTSDKISFLPYVHNVDSFGYNTDIIKKGIPYETESWGWLLDDQWRGKVALVNAPSIGIFDAALAAQARGLIEFENMGNMSVEEIDRLFDILIEKKQAGHFAGFWNSVPQSVEFMVSKRVFIESMFSPGVSSANGRGVPVTFGSTKRGLSWLAWRDVPVF